MKYNVMDYILQFDCVWKMIWNSISQNFKSNEWYDKFREIWLDKEEKSEKNNNKKEYICETRNNTFLRSKTA